MTRSPSYLIRWVTKQHRIQEIRNAYTHDAIGESRRREREKRQIQPDSLRTNPAKKNLDASSRDFLRGATIFVMHFAGLVALWIMTCRLGEGGAGKKM